MVIVLTLANSLKAIFADKMLLILQSFEHDLDIGISVQVDMEWYLSFRLSGSQIILDFYIAKLEMAYVVKLPLLL